MRSSSATTAPTMSSSSASTREAITSRAAWPRCWRSSKATPSPSAPSMSASTATTGYQEVLTDPSYAGQMVCMTYPLQGNYGVREADAESARPWARALVVRWVCPEPSHHSSEASLDAYLKRWNVPGIADIDTRALTRHLRKFGALRAVLSHEARRPGKARLEELARQAREVTPLSEQDLVAETSRTSQQEWLEPPPPEPAAETRAPRAAPPLSHRACR